MYQEGRLAFKAPPGLINIIIIRATWFGIYNAGASGVIDALFRNAF